MDDLTLFSSLVSSTWHLFATMATIYVIPFYFPAFVYLQTIRIRPEVPGNFAKVLLLLQMLMVHTTFLVLIFMALL